jgi:hypothetical protein
MATWRERQGSDRAGFKRASRYRFRRFHLRRQAVLSGNGKLRRGEVLPQPVRRRVAGWKQGWRAVREAVPVIKIFDTNSHLCSINGLVVPEIRDKTGS